MRRKNLLWRWVKLLALVPAAVPAAQLPAFLSEPGYVVENAGSTWRLVKSPLRLTGPRRAPERRIVFEGHSRAAVEKRRDALPRLRMSRPLVEFHALTRRRTVLEDWTGERDATDAEADVRAILSRFARAGTERLLAATPVYMARLDGASGHTAEQPDDPRRFVIYLDPFRATGRLHAAATLAHELTHVARYRARGFHANRAAAVLPREDFILLGLADELDAYAAEATLVEGFLAEAGEPARKAARAWMPAPELRWPPALVALLGFGAGPPTGDPDERARREVALDLERIAARYWEAHRRDALDPALERSIRAWYPRSEEWKKIAALRDAWPGQSGGL